MSIPEPAHPMKKILIIGATSAIATETARCFAADGDRLFLIARDAERLDDLAEDLRARGADRVDVSAADLLDFGRHTSLIDQAWESLEGIDEALIAHGSLSDQDLCEADYAATEKEIQTNFTSVVSLLTPLANRMADRGRGTLAVISSVAGNRGRQSNYIYGAAKAGLSCFLQGLRNRLYHEGVSVCTILPGFVDTPMTADLPKGPLFASAESVGKGIYQAMKKKKNIVYLPCFWRGIMLIIGSIPEAFFKRLKL